MPLRTVPLVLALAWPASIAVTAEVDRPNVVIVMTDDQGYGDIGAHGNPILRTPHLDELHRTSVRFTDFHVDPTCSPTRGALLTGKYSHRAGVWHTISGGNHLRASETTIAEVFKTAGYRTAMFGKWHLGNNYPYRPIDRGFDEWLGQGDGGTGTTDDHFFNDRVNDVYYHNGRREARPGWAPDVFFDAAIDWIERREKDAPFFVYLTTYVPHSPHTIADKAWADAYRKKGVGVATAYFFASVERVDRNIGRLRKCLADERLTRDTIFVFLTDNGGTGGCRVFNAGMRGRKGSPYDGGHRVPCFVHWPAGGWNEPLDVPQLTAHIDLFPTLIDLCKVPLPGPIAFDGRSLVPLRSGREALWPERTLCVELQRNLHPKKGKSCAVLTERWRWVNSAELYDIEKDPGQKSDVAAQHPEVVSRLRAEFDAYWKHVSPGHRAPPRPIVGTKHLAETFLHSSELRGGRTQWNHAHVAAGNRAEGSWAIRVAVEGRYAFEVRRWPREVAAPMRGVPADEKRVDAWVHDRPVTAMIYGKKLTALPVHAVRLEVGGISRTVDVEATDAKVVFHFDLDAGDTDVKATMLDAKKNAIGSAYYVYVTGP